MMGTPTGGYIKKAESQLAGSPLHKNLIEYAWTLPGSIPPLGSSDKYSNAISEDTPTTIDSGYSSDSVSLLLGSSGEYSNAISEDIPTTMDSGYSSDSVSLSLGSSGEYSNAISEGTPTTMDSRYSSDSVSLFSDWNEPPAMASATPCSTGCGQRPRGAFLTLGPENGSDGSSGPANSDCRISPKAYPEEVINYEEPAWLCGSTDNVQACDLTKERTQLEQLITAALSAREQDAAHRIDRATVVGPSTHASGDIVKRGAQKQRPTAARSVATAAAAAGLDCPVTPGQVQPAPPPPQSKDQLQQRRFSKTQLCHFHTLGLCRNQSECRFAHGDQDMRVCPDLTKTSICYRWARAQCPLTAKECRYAHGKRDLRAGKIGSV